MRVINTKKMEIKNKEISIIINDRNLENLEFKFIRNGITIIVGENDIGKSNILDYIYYKNEKCDGFVEHVEEEFGRGGRITCYKMPLLFGNNSYVFCQEHSDDLLRKQNNEKVEYWYEMYYFD